MRVCVYIKDRAVVSFSRRLRLSGETAWQIGAKRRPCGNLIRVSVIRRKRARVISKTAAVAANVYLLTTVYTVCVALREHFAVRENYTLINSLRVSSKLI